MNGKGVKEWNCSGYNILPEGIGLLFGVGVSERGAEFQIEDIKLSSIAICASFPAFYPLLPTSEYLS